MDYYLPYRTSPLSRILPTHNRKVRLGRSLGNASKFLTQRLLDMDQHPTVKYHSVLIIINTAGEFYKVLVVPATFGRLDNTMQNRVGGETAQSLNVGALCTYLVVCILPSDDYQSSHLPGAITLGSLVSMLCPDRWLSLKATLSTYCQSVIRVSSWLLVANPPLVLGGDLKIPS